MDSVRLVDRSTQEAERNRLVDQAVQVISQGQSVLLYSALGPDDPKIASTKKQMTTSGLSSSTVGEMLGTQQGLVLKDILAKTGLRRAAVAGGDTCGHVLKQLSIYVLEFIIPLGIAAPLCRASSSNPQLDGMEIALKGGQLGEVDFFGSVLKGKHGAGAGVDYAWEQKKLEASVSTQLASRQPKNACRRCRRSGE